MIEIFIDFLKMRRFDSSHQLMILCFLKESKFQDGMQGIPFDHQVLVFLSQGT